MYMTQSYSINILSRLYVNTQIKVYTISEEVRINQTEEKYIVNIHTGQLNMPEGEYDIYALFSNGDDNTGEIGFELVQQGKGKGRKK